MSLRRFLLPVADMIGSVLVALGFGLRPRSVRLERVEVALPDLPAHLDGYRIGVMADLHLGPLVKPHQIRAPAARLAAEQPDLVVVAGDLTSDPACEPLLDEALAPVQGALGVLGNWDYYFPPPVRTQSAVRLLVNDGLVVADGLWVGGVDDCKFGRPDVAAAMAGAPEGAVRILIAHEPDFADQVTAEDRVALVISGHSHGGQIRLPLLGPLLLPPMGRKYHTGLYRAPHTRVYTTRGLGFAHLPLRLWCPPELTVITLRRAGG